MWRSPSQPGVAEAQAQGAKIVFDFANAIGPFCNTGIMVLPETISHSPSVIQALCNGFQRAMRRVYADPAYAKAVARKEFPELPATLWTGPSMLNCNTGFPRNPSSSTARQWENLLQMQIYLKNIKGTTTFAQIVDNSFADKAVA